MSATRRPALFLDRDGTLVHPRHYPSRPEELILYDGLGPGLRRLRAAGFALVVITNQSGLARGLFSHADLNAMHAHLARELAAIDVEIDAVYYCPHHIDGVIPRLAIACDCRKPEPGMVLRAAAEHNLDLARSWLLGDILDDIEAGRRAGCRTVLVDVGAEPLPATRFRMPDFVARDTAHALDIVAASTGLGASVDLTYVPAAWMAPAPRELLEARHAGS